MRQYNPSANTASVAPVRPVNTCQDARLLDTSRKLLTEVLGYSEGREAMKCLRVALLFGQIAFWLIFRPNEC